jgi:hypothetical protein
LEERCALGWRQRAGEKRRGEAETRRRGEEGKRQRAEDSEETLEVGGALRLRLEAEGRFEILDCRLEISQARKARNVRKE